MGTLFSFSFETKSNRVHVFCQILSLVLIAQIFVCSVAASGRNSRNARTQSRRHHTHRDLDDQDEELWGNAPMELVGIFEEEDLMSTTGEYNNGAENNNYGRKRKIRSPLDEEIDEAEDSDEDDDDEPGESSSEKKMKTSTPSTITTANKSTIIHPTLPAAATHAPSNISKNHTNGNHHTNTSIHVGHISINQQHLAINHSVGGIGKNVHVNGTHGPFPPPGFQFGPPGTLPIGKLPVGVPSNKKPPHGGALPFPGKFPAHLLKNLPKPKPPPKKGELYLPEDYNNLVIPKLNLGKLIGIDAYSAVPVLVFLNIRSVRDIDESEETLTLDLDLVIEWVDGFLFDPISAITARQADITLNPIFLKKIWRPDVYIDEIVKVKRTSLMSKPLKLKFNPSNGFISYTTRLTVKLSCDMIYTYYPADTHRCEFTFRSYSYFSKDMELSWLAPGVYLQDPYDPNFDLQVESIDRLKLPQTFRKLTNDTYDGLKFTLLARRKLSFHMVQTYLPSIFFIVITWLCFLVPARMVEARIGISMTTLLTLTSMFASVRESTPIVSYVKAIDIWMVFCIFFVFLTLLEFATFVWLRARREDAEEQKLEQQRKRQESRNNGKEKDLTAFSRRPSSESISLQKYEKFAEFTEKFAFLIFSIAFVLFNVIYWSWLLVASDYFDWNVNATLNADLD